MDRMDAVNTQRTLAALVSAAATHYGDATAIMAEDGTRHSFIGLKAEVRRAARAFLADGVGKGDRIAIWAPNSVEWIVAATALQMVGAVLVPLNTRFKGPEATYILQKTGPRLLLTVGIFLGNDYPAMIGRGLGANEPSSPAIVLLDDSTRSGHVGWGDFLGAAARVEDAELDARIAGIRPEDTGDILFTSGTTGAPKGAMHSQGQHLWMVDIWNRANDLRPGDRQLVINPFFHSFGYRAGWVSGLMAGMATWPIAVFDPIQCMALIAR